MLTLEFVAALSVATQVARVLGGVHVSFVPFVVSASGSLMVTGLAYVPVIVFVAWSFTVTVRSAVWLAVFAWNAARTAVIVMVNGMTVSVTLTAVFWPAVGVIEAAAP